MLRERNPKKDQEIRIWRRPGYELCASGTPAKVSLDRAQCNHVAGDIAFKGKKKKKSENVINRKRRKRGISSKGWVTGHYLNFV